MQNSIDASFRFSFCRNFEGVDDFQMRLRTSMRRCVHSSVSVFLREPKIEVFKRAAPGGRIWCRVFGLVFLLKINRGTGRFDRSKRRRMSHYQNGRNKNRKLAIDFQVRYIYIYIYIYWTDQWIQHIKSLDSRLVGATVKWATPSKLRQKENRNKASLDFCIQLQ